MTLYLIEKSNLSGRWTGRRWWVEANTIAEAIVLGRKNWPSKNTTDQFHARPLTDDEQIAEYQLKVDHSIRHAAYVPTYAQKKADRLAAYYSRCGENQLAALDKNVRVLGTVTPQIQRIAEAIQETTATKIDRCYR